MFKWLERIFTAKRRSQSSQLKISSRHTINHHHISENALFVVEQLQNHGFEAYIVGGAVRDLLINIKPKDFDVATNATPEQVTRIFKKSRIIGKRFQIVHITFYQRKNQEIIEVTTFRAAREELATQASPTHLNQSTQSTQTSAHSLPATLKNVPSFLSQAFGRRKLKSYGETYPSHLESARQVNQTGQLVSDNIWGTQAQDASRRDFTVNAMYYDPSNGEIFDYYNGLDDIQKRCLAMIGNPSERYIEDPVRMLRVARFMAKTDFKIEAQTIEPIAGHAHLLKNIPQARLLDELLKMLTSGFAVACIENVEDLGLAAYILPWQHALEKLRKKTAVEIKGQTTQFDHLKDFIHLVLRRTDERIAQQKSVAMGFIFAGVYWPMLWQKWQDITHEDLSHIPHQTEKALSKAQTLEMAIDETLKNQQITYRIMDDMREIWNLQVRLEKRTPKNAISLLSHPRFRAAFDFLELRAISEQSDELFKLFKWWEGFQLPNADQEAFLEAAKLEQQMILKANQSNQSKQAHQGNQVNSSKKSKAAKNAKNAKAAKSAQTNKVFKPDQENQPIQVNQPTQVNELTQVNQPIQTTKNQKKQKNPKIAEQTNQEQNIKNIKNIKDIKDIKDDIFDASYLEQTPISNEISAPVQIKSEIKVVKRKKKNTEKVTESNQTNSSHISNESIKSVESVKSVDLLESTALEKPAKAKKIEKSAKSAKSAKSKQTTQSTPVLSEENNLEHTQIQTQTISDSSVKAKSRVKKNTTELAQTSVVDDKLPKINQTNQINEVLKTTSEPNTEQISDAPIKAKRRRKPKVKVEQTSQTTD